MSLTSLSGLENGAHPIYTAFWQVTMVSPGSHSLDATFAPILRIHEKNNTRTWSNEERYYIIAVAVLLQL